MRSRSYHFHLGHVRSLHGQIVSEVFDFLIQSNEEVGTSTERHFTPCTEMNDLTYSGHCISSSGSHFWGPRLYSEAQIAPFYTQITEKFSKKFCLASLGILFQFSIDIFWSKTLKNYSFLRPQIIFWGPNCTFLHSNNRKIFKKILPHFARHTISILNWHILIKNIKKLFIFEAPDYILRPKLHLFTLK